MQLLKLERFLGLKYIFCHFIITSTVFEIWLKFTVRCTDKHLFTRHAYKYICNLQR